MSAGPDVLRALAASTAIVSEAMQEMVRLTDRGLTERICDLCEDSELEIAALCYLVFRGPEPPEHWPLDPIYWEPTDRRANWIRALAFMLLEIQRTDRTVDNVLGKVGG